MAKVTLINQTLGRAAGSVFDTVVEAELVANLTASGAQFTAEGEFVIAEQATLRSARAGAGNDDASMLAAVGADALSRAKAAGTAASAAAGVAAGAAADAATALDAANTRQVVMVAGVARTELGAFTRLGACVIDPDDFAGATFTLNAAVQVDNGQTYELRVST